MAAAELPSANGQALDAGRRSVLNRRIRLLVAATITYNVIEAAVALTAGQLASSSALIGFGLDSLVEVGSAAAVAWQFSATDPEAREKTALRIIAVSFFALAAFVPFDALRSLLFGGEAAESVPGMVLAALSLAIMPVLSWAQRRAGRELGSRSAVADSKQTLLCTYLSAVLLVGLVLNAWLGWSWADPVAALAIAAVALKEGREAWKGDACCAPNAGAFQTGTMLATDANAAVPDGTLPDGAASGGTAGDGCDCCSPGEQTEPATPLGQNTAPSSEN